jgi:hypothetical protein
MKQCDAIIETLRPASHEKLAAYVEPVVRLDERKKTIDVVG